MLNRSAFWVSFVVLGFTSLASAQSEPVACLSADPSAWPASSRPYFVVIGDTGLSMGTETTVATTCGYGSTRSAHLRCALRRTFETYTARANFALGTFPMRQTGCSGAACSSCTISAYPGDTMGCGTGTGATRRGLAIRVPMLQDSHWGAPQPPNAAALLSWVNDACDSSGELFASGERPLGGALRDAYRYLSTSWTAIDSSATYATPLAMEDRACRSVNVILVMDGSDSCDAATEATSAAAALLSGVTVGGKTFNVRTWVVALPGASAATADAIAAAGGTTASYSAANETQLITALGAILNNAGPRPEVCDNVDNSCNGCTDEGFTHYCNQRASMCCAWATPAQRATCLANYRGSISAGTPRGNLTLLPCTTPAQQSVASTWLCYPPGEICDSIDNDCSGGVDDGVTRCGSPLHCPVAESCNGADDDCDGLIDDGAGCASCVPSAEVCDGCDNDCDSVADEGVASVACGLATPANCSGMLSCRPPVSVAIGACSAGGGWGACSNVPQVETCDGVDQDCDGVPDDGLPSISCVPAGTPAGLVFGPTSACQRGLQPCGGGVCLGFVGPSVEVCNGLDDDCDGVVDDGVAGVGAACGSSTPPCTPGVTACIFGALVCQGGTGATPEQCNGRDDDCDGTIDDGPLADQPAFPGCWSLPGNCCTVPGLNWCPPPGATCVDAGGLGGACTQGSLVCSGGAWSCAGERRPSAELCNGLDDDCNGTVDDGVIAGIGGACGVDVGECTVGVLACTSGSLVCTGAEARPESCNGRDDDCDGLADDDIDSGATCTVPFDEIAFPGDRTSGACRPGLSACDGGGTTTCAGGVGPAAEVCNGVDDDCDGDVDETGAAPDGIDGSDVEAEGATVSIGTACGAVVGACMAGSWACAGGAASCSAQAPSGEDCDCIDDDCDGSTDESEAGSAVCGAGATCRTDGTSCGCVSTCATDDECPVGSRCEDTTESGTGSTVRACVPIPCGGDCAGRWIASGDMVACAPEGTLLDGCITPPVCTCTELGCASPCDGVTCADGEACAQSGPDAGTCIPTRCPDVPCNSCGVVCAPDGACVDDPCDPSPCAAGERCVPDDSLRSFTCEGGSDAGVADAGVIDASAADASTFDAGGSTGTAAGGCGCTAAGSGSRTGGGLLLLLVGLVVVARRRRRAAVAVGLAALVAVVVGCGSPPAADDDASTIDASGIDASGVDASRDAASVDSAAIDACVATVEVCNGRDDDCNGTADDVDEDDLQTCGGCGNDCTAIAIGCMRDGVTCSAGACGCDLCAPGLRDLDGDGSCESACAPTADTDADCDSVDDDCDGTRDEDVDFCGAPNCGACGEDCTIAHGVGACAMITGCGAGEAQCEVTSCVCAPGDCWHDADGLAATGCEYRCDVANGGVERCDGIDDDCDGSVDEDVTGDARLGVQCFGDPDGVCATPAHAGTTVCVAGAVVCRGPILMAGAMPELCNAVDDDCDGVVDDAPTDSGAACGTSSTAPCRRGVTSCESGALVCRGGVEPAVETCNGRDDDCDGTIDGAPSDAVGACSVPPPPPAGATSPCVAGALACIGGRVACVGAVGPSAPFDACGVDSNCDGALTGQPSFTSDVANCGSCGRDCRVGSVHATWSCASAACRFDGCQAGYYDLDGNQTCEYACTFRQAAEACNGEDDNCDGRIDEGVIAPPVASVCGTSPSAAGPECTSAVTVSCVSGAWRCSFPAGVCTGGCDSGDEICDLLDNDCDGVVNENTPGWNTACASDAGLPAPGHGACRTTGVYVCNGPGTITCNATPAACATLPGGCTELCDGVDNDCDGSVDEPFTSRGTNAANFVRPTVTHIAASVWMYSFEASRPSASVTIPGTGNGYWTSAPAGRTLDRTSSCSVAGRIPWSGVTPAEAQQVCTAMGGSLCTRAQFQTACRPDASCQYGYNPRGTACATPFALGSRYCNLGPSYDFSSSLAGDQDGLLTTGSPLLQNCWSDWSGLQGNTTTTNKIFDLTGNLAEIVSETSTVFEAMGGSYSTAVEAGAACSVTTDAFDSTMQRADLGFRCCFSSDPTL